MRRNREALIFKHSTCRFIADSRGTELKLTSKKERREMGWGRNCKSLGNIFNLKFCDVTDLHLGIASFENLLRF